MDLLRSLAAATNLEHKLEGLQKALAEMKRYQEEQGWYEKGDIEGSLLRLRGICAEKPDDEVACGILAVVDKELEKIAIDEPDTGKLGKECENIITAACRRSFRTSSRVQSLKHKTCVPWWSDELTMLRKRTNATSRR